MNKIFPLLLCLLLASAAFSGEVSITSESSSTVAIANDRLALRFDLGTGTYEAIDPTDGTVCLRDAFWSIGDWSSRDA